MSDITGRVPFSFWFTPLSMRTSCPPMQTAVSHSFSWPVFHCMNLPLLCPSTCQRLFSLPPCLSYCERCCYEHWGPCIFLISQGVGLLDHMATLVLVFWQTSLPFSIVAASVFLSFPFSSSFFFPKQRVGTGLAPKSLHNTHHKWPGGQIRRRWTLREKVILLLKLLEDGHLCCM